VVLAGFFPALRTLPGGKAAIGMPIAIEIVMLATAALMLALTRTDVDAVPKTATCRAGIVAVVGIFGLAWLGDSFIAANKDVIVPAIGKMTEAAPWTFAFGLFFASVLLYSQAATTRALMPLGIALGIPPQFLIAMFPVGAGARGGVRKRCRQSAKRRRRAMRYEVTTSQRNAGITSVANRATERSVSSNLRSPNAN
jgi:anaerobic C4-dicarboxylate transporter DcuA